MKRLTSQQLKSQLAALKNFQIDSEDSSSKNKLQRLRAQYTYLKTRGPTIKEQLAAASDGQARTKLLEEAAAEAKEVWGKYRNYSPAIASCLTAARCYQDLGQSESSQEMVDQLLTLQRSQVPASIRREALSIAAANWQNVDPFPWKTVIDETENPVKLLTPEQVLNSQWQAVQLALARAFHEKSQSLAGEKGATAKRESQEASATAIKLAQTVAQSAGDAREQAVNFLKQWGSGSDVPAPAIANTAGVKAESFASAVQLGRAALPDVESLLRKINEAKRKVGQAGASQKQQQQNELDQLKQQQLAKTSAALDLFKQAIFLADESAMMTSSPLTSTMCVTCKAIVTSRESSISSRR